MLFIKLSTALALGFTAVVTAAPAAVPPPEMIEDLDLPFDAVPTAPVEKRVPPPEMVEGEFTIDVKKRVPPPDVLEEWESPPFNPNGKRVPPPEDLEEWESPPFNPNPDKRVPPPDVIDELDLPFDPTPTQPVEKRVPPPDIISECSLSFQPTPTKPINARGPPPVIPPRPGNCTVHPGKPPGYEPPQDGKGREKRQTPSDPIHTLPVENPPWVDEPPQDGKGREKRQQIERIIAIPDDLLTSSTTTTSAEPVFTLPVEQDLPIHQ